jgi:large subunit ribosomal protein L9
MRIILRKDVEKLGEMGDIVNVKNGYARNYLIPREMAYFASDSALKRLQVEKKLYDKKLERERAKALELSSKITEIQVSIPMKVGEEGRLYGSVTPGMVADELALHGIEIDRRNINIEDPIKTLGVFDVKVKLHTDVIATLKVWVISEEE